MRKAGSENLILIAQTEDMQGREKRSANFLMSVDGLCVMSIVKAFLRATEMGNCDRLHPEGTHYIKKEENKR